MAESFGGRLRQQRERRQITLESIARDTNIGVSLLEGLERDDVSHWPAGIFRRSFVRAYARAVGLEPDALVREFLVHHPDTSEPITTASIAAARAGIQSPADRPQTRLQLLFSAARDYPHRFMSAVGRLGPAVMSGCRTRLAFVSRSHPVVIKVSIVPDSSAFVGGQCLRSLRCRWVAAACDAGMLVVMALTMRVAFDSFWASFGISTFCYYLTSVLILGNTPGICLCAPADPARRGGSQAGSSPDSQPAPAQTADSWVSGHVEGATSPRLSWRRFQSRASSFRSLF